MEFTYHGLVRYAYGFANPNHAAALITILLPFLWVLRVYAKRLPVKIIVFTLEYILYLALIFTYSRTGFFVVIMSAAIFWAGKYFFIDKTKWNDVKLKSFLSKRVLGIVAVLFVIGVLAISFKAVDRYSSWIANPEKSITNRFLIWKGATQIIAENPQGVGAERSGFLFSNLYCPPENDITCRTMINSFLTFAAEQGIWLSLLLLSFLYTAVFLGLVYFMNAKETETRRIFILSMLTAIFAGGLSGIMSTCFDLNIANELLNLPQSIELNIYMQSVLLIIWCILPFLLIITVTVSNRANFKNLGKSGALALLLSTVIIVIMYSTGKYFEQASSCKITQRAGTTFITIKRNNSFSSLLFIPDKNTLTFKESLRWLKQNYPDYNYEIPLTELSKKSFVYSCDTVVLCGESSFWSNKISTSKIHLLLPNSILNKLPSNIKTISLPAFDNDGHNATWIELVKSTKYSNSKYKCKIKLY